MSVDPIVEILDNFDKKSYMGQESDVVVKRILSQIHCNVISICRKLNYKHAISIFYYYYDESCAKNIDLRMWIEEDRDAIGDYSAFPTMFKYIIECLLYTKNKDGMPLSKENQTSLVLLSLHFVHLSNLSNYLYFNEYNGGIEILEDCSYKQIIPENEINIQNEYLEEIKLQKDSMLNPIKYYSKPKKTKKLSNIFKRFDAEFHEIYSINLSDVAKVIEELYKLVNRNMVITSYSSLVTKLYRKTKIKRNDVITILSFFEFNEDIFYQDWNYYKFYQNKNSFSLTPILRNSGSIGENGEIFFGRNALLKACVLMYHYIEEGILEMGVNISKNANLKGTNFENEIMNEICRYGYNVNQIKSKPNREDLDVTVYDEKTKKLIILEAKAYKIDISVSTFQRQQQTTLKWCNQLERKIIWVKSNLERVCRLIDITYSESITVQGYVISKTPYVKHPDVSCMILTQEELFLKLRNNMF